MSRLVENDVRDMKEHLADYDLHLREICRAGLGEVAQNAAGTTTTATGVRVAVIPVTAGLGVIGGFCRAVADILEFLGAQAEITGHTDVKGIWEAVTGQYDVAFLADDATFLAVNLKKCVVSDNSEATGRAFAAALDLAASGISEKDALVLGAGPVGQSAAYVLQRRGGRVSIYDADGEKSRALASDLPGIKVENDLREALRRIPFVVDATPAPAFLTPDLLRDDVIIAAPGVPLGVSTVRPEDLSARLIHDVLDLGVATMLFDVI